jgi:hypothetical protein
MPKFINSGNESIEFDLKFGFDTFFDSVYREPFTESIHFIDSYTFILIICLVK